jgi:hypothetical protein
LVYRVAEASVTGVACQHDPSGARGPGDRGGAGVVAAGLGIDEPARVVAELAENPGAEHHADAGQAQVAFSTKLIDLDE